MLIEHPSRPCDEQRAACKHVLLDCSRRSSRYVRVSQEHGSVASEFASYGILLNDDVKWEFRMPCYTRCSIRSLQQMVHISEARLNVEQVDRGMDSRSAR